MTSHLDLKMKGLAKVTSSKVYLGTKHHVTMQLLIIRPPHWQRFCMILNQDNLRVYVKQQLACLLLELWVDILSSSLPNMPAAVSDSVWIFIPNFPQMNPL
uniref:Uncharacterized protein n=1 Tax=Graphocephala atropunctata TaxID=36148 RepID=A0A1B6M2C8_9HEMI